MPALQSQPVARDLTRAAISLVFTVGEDGHAAVRDFRSKLAGLFHGLIWINLDRPLPWHCRPSEKNGGSAR